MRERTYVAVINMAPLGEEWPGGPGWEGVESRMEKDLRPGTLVLVRTEGGQLPHMPVVECQSHDSDETDMWYVSKRNFNILGEL